VDGVLADFKLLVQFADFFADLLPGTANGRRRSLFNFGPFVEENAKINVF